MKITKLEYQKNNPNRVNVYVDGAFAVGIGANDVVSLGLFKNQEISQDSLNKIISQSEFGKAFNLAFNFLSFRPRSEWEVRQYLKRKKFENTNEVIEKLKKIGQINDENFAKWWQDQRNTFRPKGSRFIEYELKKKGVNVKLKKDNSLELELALKAVKKKREMPKEKLIRFLFSRGFDYETIETVIAKIGPKE